MILVPDLLYSYIERIETYGFEDGALNFSHGFQFFKESRALNREANYRFAKALIAEYEAGDSAKFSLMLNAATEQRNAIIRDYQLYMDPNFKDRGINSKELKKAIKSYR
jgi:hypothetical protein